MERTDLTAFRELLIRPQTQQSAFTLFSLSQVYIEGQGLANFHKIKRRVDFLWHEFNSQFSPFEELIVSLSALNDFFYQEKKYQKDTENLPQSLFLSHLLETQKGHPFILALLFREFARRMALAPVNLMSFPGNFFIKVFYNHQLMFLDPADKGRLLSVHELQKRLARIYGKEIALTGQFLETPSEIQLLVKYLSILKENYLQQKNWNALLTCLDLLIEINPLQLNEHKERGLLLYQLGQFEDAYKDLSLFINRAPPTPEIEKLKKFVKHLQTPHSTQPLH